MYQKFVDNISKKNLIQKKDKILACVSGGADSMSMLHMLIKYFDNDKSRIEVAHFNHQLRGKYSKRDAEFVGDFCRKNSIKFHLKSMDIEKLARDEKLSIEECGRKYRYDFFYDIIKDYDNCKISLAHNLDDQAETVLMRIIRGTGIDGLIAIKEKDGKIIRPLLNISRKEIEDYIVNEHIEFVQDHTNFENDYTRNKIRNELIPLIEKNFNPAFKDALIKLSVHAHNDKRIRNIYIEKLYYELIVDEKNSSIYIDKKLFNDLERFVQLQVIRFTILKLRGNLLGFDLAHFIEFLNLRNSKEGKEVVINDISVSTSKKHLIIKQIKENPLDTSISINGSGNIEINGFSISYNLDESQGLIRKRKNGDRIYYKNKYRKLKDYFINKKIDMADRDFYPIIEIDGSIIAVANLYKNQSVMDELKIRVNVEGGLDYGSFKFS